MHKSTRLRALIRNVTAHVTLEEDEQIKQRAASVNLSKSEWARQVILQSFDVSPDTRLLLAEFLAMRKIFLAVHIEALHGRKLSESLVKEVIESIEVKKFVNADEHIRLFRIEHYGQKQ